MDTEMEEVKTGKKRKRLQKCQRKRKKRLLEQMAQCQIPDASDTEMSNPGQPNSTLALTSDHRAQPMDIDDVTPVESIPPTRPPPESQASKHRLASAPAGPAAVSEEVCGDIEPGSSSPAPYPEYPGPGSCQPKPKPWTPFTNWFLLAPNTFQFKQGKTSHGRFPWDSYLGKALGSISENGKDTLAGHKLRNNILWYLSVHSHPLTADGTNPGIVSTMEELEQSDKLLQLGNIFQDILNFHLNIPNMRTFVRFVTTTIHPQGKLQSKRKNHKRRIPLSQKLANGNVPQKVVISIISTICRKSGAFKLLGSRNNQRHFLKFFRRFLLAGFSSRLHLSLLLEVLTPGHCTWLEEIEDPSLRIHIFAKVTYWLLCDYIFNILKLGFYVTETESTKSQFNFFLADSWENIGTIVKDNFVNTKQMTQVKVKGLNGVQVNSTVKFKPKKGSLRPLIGSKAPRSFALKADMDQMRLLLSYLSIVVAPHATSSSQNVLVRNSWKKFRNDLEDLGQSSSQLFYIRLDIKNAFPSVDISKLQTILTDLVESLNFTLRTVISVSEKPMDVVTSGGGDVRLLRMHHSCRIPDMFHTDAHPFPTQDVLRKVLRVIKSKVIFKLGNKIYDFSHGLPQGSPLSTLLCLIYYGQMEKDYLAEFLGRRGEFFCRCVDDYVFVSTDPERVRALYSILKPGIPDYGFVLNPTKTVGNVFDNSESALDSKCLKYCGWIFNLRNGHISRDFSYYADLDPCAAINFSMASFTSVEEFVMKRLLSFLSLRLCSNILDLDLNCKWQIGQTLLDCALLTVFRFVGVCRVVYPSLDAAWKDPVKGSILFEVITTYAKKLLSMQRQYGKKTKFRPKDRQTCQCLEEFYNVNAERMFVPFNILEVKYIVLKAFMMKLVVHSSRPYSGLLELIEQAVDGLERSISRAPRYAYLRRLLGSGIPDYFKAMHG